MKPDELGKEWGVIGAQTQPQALAEVDGTAEAVGYSYISTTVAETTMRH
jgi:hypothetical protein